MIAKLIFAGVFSVFVATGAAGQTVEPCELTQAEDSARRVALDRLVHPGYPAGIVPATELVAGCGVWKVEVATDGSVSSVEFVRGQPVGAYERFVGGWLKTFHFARNVEPWNAYLLIRFTDQPRS